MQMTLTIWRVVKPELLHLLLVLLLILIRFSDVIEITEKAFAEFRLRLACDPRPAITWNHVIDQMKDTDLDKVEQD